MALGTSLLLIAVGAILRFAVSVTTHGFSIHTIGVILMIVGAVGLVISLLWMMVWRDRQAARPGYVDRRDYVGRDAPPPEAY
jgi:beta-lactamase regulating signal transducer with metallopeptidase domain